LRAAFEEQQRESEGEGKTDETHQEKRKLTMERSDSKGSDSLEEAMLKQVEEYGFQKGFKQGFEQEFKQSIEKGVRKTIFQLFQNGFDVLQVSKMLTMDEAIIGNLRAAFEEQQRESEGEGKTDETHQEKKVIDDEEE
jgi:ABC-type microcin C transport system permease subunit YejB